MRDGRNDRLKQHLGEGGTVEARLSGEALARAATCCSSSCGPVVSDRQGVSGAAV